MPRLALVRVRCAPGERSQMADLVAIFRGKIVDVAPESVIVEVTGEKKKDKVAKVATARALWVPAINNHGGFGRWAFIEVADADRHRLMVATKGWAESHINEVKGPRTWVVFAAMLIVPDGTPQQLRASIDAAVAMGAVRHFGHPASSSEPAA